MLAAAASVMLWSLAGGQLLADDFETGALVKPAGRWDQAITMSLPVPVALVSAAAHRGDAGLSYSREADGGVIGDWGTFLELTLTPAVAAGTLSARMWMRERQTNDTDALIFGQFLADNTMQPVIAEVGFHHSQGEKWRLQGYDCVSSVQSGVSAPGFDGGWHLAELELDGLGTDAGERVLIIDGVVVTRAPGDFSNAQVTTFRVGDVYLYLDVGDTMDFDDVRVDTRSQADALTVMAQPFAAGDCTLVLVALVDWQGNARATPYGFTATLSVPPGLTVYPTVGCTGLPITQISFGVGNTGVPVPVRASAPGLYPLQASYADFLTKPSLLAVTADAGLESDAGPDAGAYDDSDAGTDAGVDAGLSPADAGALPPRIGEVDCGCSSSSALLPLLALLSLRRRRQLKS